MENARTLSSAMDGNRRYAEFATKRIVELTECINLLSNSTSPAVGRQIALLENDRDAMRSQKKRSLRMVKRCAIKRLKLQATAIDRMSFETMSPERVQEIVYACTRLKL